MTFFSHQNYAKHCRKKREEVISNEMGRRPSPRTLRERCARRHWGSHATRHRNHVSKLEIVAREDERWKSEKPKEPLTYGCLARG